MTSTAIPCLTSLLSKAEFERFAQDGYVIIENLLAPEEVDAFVQHAARPEVVATTKGKLLNHRTDARWDRIARNPRIIAVARQLIGGPLHIVQTMYLDKPAGGAGHSLHQDTHYIPNEPNTLMACWLAMTDTDADNGGLCVVPGSHRRGLLSGHANTDAKEHDRWEVEHTMLGRDGREWTQRFFAFQVDGVTDDQIVRLTVPKGGGVFFSGLLIHGSFANRSSARPRLAFATHYVCAGTWLPRKDIHDTVPV